MKKLLVINSSARLTRSVTRKLTQRAEKNWLAHHLDGVVQHIDVGLTPPPAVDESWIAAAYSRPGARTAEMIATLRPSDIFIDQLIEADAIVIGAPIYNFGLPAQLKAFFEQIVRIGRTFDFGANTDSPYVGLLRDIPVLVVTSSGSSTMNPGGETFHLNFLEPHLMTILGLMGLTNVTFARMSGQQADPETLARAFVKAEQEVDAWLARIDSGNPESTI